MGMEGSKSTDKIGKSKTECASNDDFVYSTRKGKRWDQIIDSIVVFYELNALSYAI